MDNMIIYCCDDYVVADKPGGMISESGDNSFPAELQKLLGGEIYPIHRLDKEVTGVMVYARNKNTAAYLSSCLQRGEFDKRYIAVVHGKLEIKDGVMKDFLYKNTASNKSFIVKRMRKGVKEAELTYSVVEYKKIGEQDATVVDIHLMTGRHHQIRAQFAGRKHPLFGDRRYGAGQDGVKNIALRCYKLSFPDRDGNILSYEKDKNKFLL